MINSAQWLILQSAEHHCLCVSLHRHRDAMRVIALGLAVALVALSGCLAQAPDYAQLLEAAQVSVPCCQLPPLRFTPPCGFPIGSGGLRDT